MVGEPTSEKIRPQRIKQKNIEIIEKYGKPKTGESFDDVLSRVLEEYVKLKKKRVNESEH